jgi:hypothetical protein
MFHLLSISKILHQLSEEGLNCLCRSDLQDEAVMNEDKLEELRPSHYGVPKTAKEYDLLYQ